MFEVITDKLQNVLGSLNSKGRLSESDIDSALREIRRALLESDVNFQVAREFVQSVRANNYDSSLICVGWVLIANGIHFVDFSRSRPSRKVTI